MSNRRLLCAVVGSLLWPVLASAQGLFEDAVEQSKTAAPAPAEEKSSGGASKPGGTGVSGVVGGIGFELNGHLRSDLFLGKIPDREATETKTGYGELALKVRARKGDYGDAYSEVRLRAGYEAGETSTQLDLREAYVNVYLGPFDFRAGHQVIVWGRADGVNPTNNLTPRDMSVRSPLEDDMRLANLALRSTFNHDPLRLEAVWIPFFAPSHFPRFELPDGIELAAPDWPGPNVRNGTVAGRVHLLWSALELSLSYLVGYATFPGISLEDVSASGDGGPDIAVAFEAYRHQVVGADFSTSVGSFGLRGEFAFRYPFHYQHEPHVPLPDLQYVLGIDHEFFGEVSVIAQYSGRTVLDWEHDQVAEHVDREELSILEQLALTQLLAKNRMIAGQLEQIQHSATLRVEWRLLQETLRMEVLGMVNFTTEELLLRPKIAYDITDALTATVGGEIYLGADDTLFGMIDEMQSAGFVELRASF